MKKIFLFLFISLFIAGCSKKTETEYMNKAKESWQKNDITEAINAYESLVKDYPDGVQAPKALMELGKIYQYKVDKKLTDRESLDKAVETFKKLFARYPKSDEAPLALFMIAFIQANELQMYDEATKNYKLFIEKFPEHPMAQNAKDELSTMGMTPDQILSRRLDENN